MRERPEDTAAGLAESLEAAGALIESLEDEVASLRRDLESATAALRAAQEEVSARADAERETEDLRSEISGLKRRHSDEQLRMGNEHVNELARVQRTLEEQRRADVEAAASGTRLEAIEEEFAHRDGREESATGEERHEAPPKGASDGRESETRTNHQGVTEIESLRRELESRRLAVEEAHKEVKALAEGREHELRRSQASKLAEVEQVAERRIETLRAQREADNRALRARHAEEVGSLRRGYEERLASEDERKKSETWALEERLREAGIRRETELAAYGSRLKELEAARLAERSAAETEFELTVRRLEAEITAREDRVAELEDALEGIAGTDETGEVAPVDGGRQEQDATDAQRTRDLEARLLEAREEARRNAEGLEAATESLRRLSEPGRRLRDGIALFNESEHAGVVAAISRSLGLPKVHAGLDGETPGKPVLTLLWGDVSWRRYVSDPTEGVPEPRVYLDGTGEEPAEVPVPERQPNARMDARGRLTLGVQAR